MSRFSHPSRLLNWWPCLIAVVAIGVGVASTRAQDEPPASEPEPAADASLAPDAPSWQEYRETVVAGNIFSRQRSRGDDNADSPDRDAEPDDERDDETPKEPETPTDPASFFALRGVSYVGETGRAFFEDLRDGTIRSIAVGEDAAGRRVAELTLDGIRVEQIDAGEAYTIDLGDALAGGEPRDADGASSAPPDAEQTEADDAADEEEVDEGERSIIERLRRRRQEQIDQ